MMMMGRRQITTCDGFCCVWCGCSKASSVEKNHVCRLQGDAVFENTCEWCEYRYTCDKDYLSMGRANAYPEGNEQDWIGWVDLLYTPADAAPFDQKSQTHTLSIQGENCTWTCDQTEAVFGDLISVHVSVAEGYTLQGATVTVNGVKLDVARNITYAGSDTQVKLVFGMPQENAEVIITPVKK